MQSLFASPKPAVSTIGLGNMGGAIATCLLALGCTLHGHGHDADAAKTQF